MCQGLRKIVALAALVVVRGSERLPSTSRKLDESVCFDLVLEDDAGNDRDGTMYTITTLTDGEVVAVGNMRSNSTRNSGSPRLQTDRVCVEEAPVCLRIVVAEGVAWSAGGVASGPAGVNGDFAVLDGGEIAEDDELCATADSSTSNCFLFEMTSSSGEGWKGGYYRITNVNGKTLTIDTTSAEVSTETHAVCVTEAPACYTVDVVAGLDNQIGWTLGGVLTGVAPDPGQSFNVLPGGIVVEATCTFSPTLSPTHSLSPTLTHAPSILTSSFEQPISTFASLSLAMTLLERGRKEAFEIVVEGTIVFENEIEIEDNAVDIRGVGKMNGTTAQPPYAVFDGDHRTRMFTVRDSAVLSLSDLILRNALVDAASSGGVIDVSGSEVYLYRCVFAYNHGGRGGAISASDSVVNAVNTTFSNNTAERSGAAAYVAFASEMNVVDSVFDSNYAAIAGAAFLVDQSALSVRTSSFNSNVAWFGGTIAASTASLDFDSCTFVSNRANERGGVIGMSTTSLNVANCSYDANSAALTSAVFHSWVSAVNIEASTFTSNTAGSHAGVSESFSSEVSIVGCAFHSNSAVEEGGVFRASSSQVHVEESTFDSNSASTGGALYVEESSTFDIVGSNFSSNSAIVGGAIRVTHGSLLQLQGIALDSSSAADNASHFLSCQTSSTIYAALTMLDSSQKFDLAETCVMYFYLANNDGSNDFKIDTLQAVIGETGTIDLRHWTYPCTAGKYSSDGLEHGDTAAYEDRNGQTIDFNDPNCEPDAPPSSPLSCSASCAPCPSGTYSEFTMDRYSLVGATSCSNCPVGRYLSDDGVDASKHDSQDDCEACPPGRFGDEVGASACKLCAEGKYSSEPESIFCVSAEPGYFVSGSGSSVHLPCPAGRYSVGEAGFCDACPPGTYQSRSGQTTCSLARPGYFVNQSEGIDEKPCPPGSISAGSGSERCTRCKPGEYQPNPGRSSCLLARPGSFVQNVAASEQEACEAGTFSASGAANCSECEIGRYNSDDMNADCRTCPTPMNTTRAGSTYCDACSSGFYFDTMYWENKGQFEWNTSGTHCVDCCVECDEDGMVCDQSGVELLSLVVESGWWRATSRSKEVYECDFRKACKGGNLTESDEQCSNGHKGARCGACEKDFVYSPIKQRCVKCGNKVQIISSAASILVFFLLTGVLVFSWLRRFGSRYHWHTITRVVSMVARDEMSSGAETGSELFSDRGGRNASRENEDDEDEDQKRDQLLRSVLTKLKIVVATWQIASSTEWVLSQVNFPDVYAYVMSAFGILGFSFLEFTSLDCLLNWTYFEKLVFATVFPFVVILLIASIYLGVWMKCYAEAFRRDRDRVLANTMYFALLVFYVTLPVASSWTFGYFNCVSFDRGDGENDLKVLMADPSVKCTSPRYHAWFAYVIFSCLVWPIGMPLGVGVLLWRNRRRLNPIIPDNYLARRSSSGTVEHTQAFQRERLRHKIAMQQLAKLDIRDKDKNLRFLEFVFEEYEPRCYMFPVFEILRRIFLTAMLMAFYPGSMTQVVVGMLASMISFTVYNHYEPYIEDDDDVVSAVAQTQLILVYFAAFVVYASENMDSKEGVFSSDAFGVFLILLFLASFVVAISTIFLELWGYTALSNHLDATRHTFMSRSSSLFTSLRRQQTSSPRKQDSSLKDLRSSLSSQSSLSRKSSIGSIRNDPEAPGEEVVSEQTTGDIVGVALLDNDDDEVPEKPHPKDRTSFEDGKAELSQ